MNEVTRIINAVEQGDAHAAEKLLPLVYEELRVLATQKMALEKPGQTLQATALVHEAYIRLVGSEAQNWSGRTQFFTAAAEAMRRILIENARRKQSLKRGGAHKRADLDEAILAVEGLPEDVLALDEALTRLAQEEPVAAEIVKLRYFAGLTVEQAGELVGTTRRTATRHWTFARAWLYKQIAKGSTHHS